MDIGFEQIKDMTIGEVLKLKQDHDRVSKELEFVKRKYPKAKEELEDEKFNLDEFLASC